MPYVKISTGELIDGDGRGALQAAFPNVSWPAEPKPTDLDAVGVAETSPRPSDTLTHTFAWDGSAWAKTPRAQADADARRAEWEARMAERITDEADRRVDLLSGDPKRALRVMLGMVAKGAAINMKRGRGQASAQDEAFADQLAAVLSQSEAIRTAQDAILAELPTADPDTFDVENHPAWP